MSVIPVSEAEAFQRGVRAHPEYFRQVDLIDAFCQLGLTVVADPFGDEVTHRVIAAIQSERAFSVVRIGDGEANLLSFGVYPGTPLLDRFAAVASLRSQQDKFAVNDTWMHVLREMMVSSIAQADVVGVIGLWRSAPDRTVDWLLDLFRQDPRGACGHWRAMDRLLQLARAGFLDGKVVASAHLYFAVISRIEDLVAAARRVLLVTDRCHLKDAFLRRFPRSSVEVVHVGAETAPLEDPNFLDRVYASLPRDMRGCLCLVGAGVWAEIYCSWIKQRGGVGVDIGSGFDLLDGVSTRPVHRALDANVMRGLALDRN